MSEVKRAIILLKEVEKLEEAEQPGEIDIDIYDKIHDLLDEVVSIVGCYREERENRYEEWEENL